MGCWRCNKARASAQCTACAYLLHARHRLVYSLLTVGTFGDKNVERKRCTYGSTLVSLRLTGACPISAFEHVKLTSYVRRLRSTFWSPKVPSFLLTQRCEQEQTNTKHFLYPRVQRFLNYGSRYKFESRVLFFGWWFLSRPASRRIWEKVTRN